MITLPLPPSVNRIYKIRSSGRGIYKDAKARDWEEEAGWELKRQWGKPPYKSQVYLGIVYFMKVDSESEIEIKSLRIDYRASVIAMTNKFGTRIAKKK